MGFVTAFKIRICKSNRDQAGCCSADPALVLIGFRIELGYELLMKLEFSVLTYQDKNNPWSLT